MAIADDIQAIAGIIQDYRQGEILAPDSAHVERWLGQFASVPRVGIAAELRHILQQVYLRREHVEAFCAGLVTNPQLTGGSADFWRNADVMNIQRNGHSQRDMLAILGSQVLAQTGILLEPRPNASTFVYLDDIIFSGSRARNDLRTWIEHSAPAEAHLHIIVFAYYESGRYYLARSLRQCAEAVGKAVRISFWKVVELDARKSSKDTGHVLWPTVVPAEAEAFRDAYCPDFQPRIPDRHKGFFSCEAGRHVLEQEMLKAGLRIRGFSNNPNDSLRPLGFGQFGFGFGSMVVTYRNCPNNAPLALWWGDPNAPAHHPFSKWYPLLPRATYGD